LDTPAGTVSLVRLAGGPETYRCASGSTKNVAANELTWFAIEVVE